MPSPKDIRLEVQTMRLSSHPNVLVCHTSFVRDTDLWLVTQLMSKGSSLHCLQSARAKLLKDASPEFMCTSDDGVLEGGLTSHAAIIDPEVLVFETHITYILYETLLGLKYIHENGQIHRDIKAGNLLLDGNANVRIADFGVSSWLIDSGNRREHTTTFVGTPCWSKSRLCWSFSEFADKADNALVSVAPEVMEQVDGYDYKADIWSLGITALELCKGFAPYAKYAPMKVLLLTIQEDPPSFETYNDGDGVNMWSKSFRSMIKLCLQKDPQKRPTCQELLANKHFKPLSKAEDRLKWREDTRKELCDVIEDVGNTASDGARGRLPGAVPIQVVATMKRDRPAGTSWILPGGSQVHSSSVLDDAESDDFFDQFEKVTSGENFNRDESAANSIAATRVEVENTKPSEKKEDEDDMNDFFDQFEKETGGENFKR
ncbi:hypothetical protein THAOC_37799 [Thalassiosira oceanica]|uniref:Protein kinase domain-containing protein n=2 Tax=Thalassiosira oceanica TaxID=159749 RepID=K0RBB0_THAOC|nr:hypothetical protein THAOC_37799 [Thalassiosira oceanica]|eukprot:EJK43732.1 hypothetical protein THAOC_37799 [Thalassiosira oceanica]